MNTKILLELDMAEAQVLELGKAYQQVPYG